MLCTPASPTPLTEDGDDLLVELRTFLLNVRIEGSMRSRARKHAQTALRLLRHLPVSRDAVLEYFGALFSMSAVAHLEAKDDDGLTTDEELSKTLNDLYELLRQLLKTNAPAWAPILSHWSLTLLGELSSAHSQLVKNKYQRTCSDGLKGKHPQALGIHETMPIWMSSDTGRILANITVDCISGLRDQSASDQTHMCVSSLLDVSVQHRPHFDWVVAFVGGYFPDTIIECVLKVGLQDFITFVADNQTLIAKEGCINVAKVPKMNSVVNILSHLGATHKADIAVAVHNMVKNSLVAGSDGDVEELCEETQELFIGTVPFLLYLATQSDVISSCLFDQVHTFISAEVADSFENLVPEWQDQYFPAQSVFLEMLVHLATVSTGQNARDILQLLLEFSADQPSCSKGVKQGCRLILDLLLSDLLIRVHQNAPYSGEEIPLLTACKDHYTFFLNKFLLSGSANRGQDGFLQKSLLLLVHIVSLYAGKSLAVQTLVHGLTCSTTDTQLSLLLHFIGDMELWIPDLVKTSVKQSFSSGKANPEPLLRNLGKLLQFQSDCTDDQLRIVSRWKDSMEQCQDELLTMLDQPHLIHLVLMLFHLLQLPVSRFPVRQLHRASIRFVRTLFVLLQEDQHEDQDQRLRSLFHCVQMLEKLASKPPGIHIVLRTMIEGSIQSPFARLFGGRTRDEDSNVPTAKSKQLFEENLKFSRSLGRLSSSSMVFHAGIIGNGKDRKNREEVLPKERADENCFVFVSVLFKLCHSAGFADAGSHQMSPGSIDRDRAKEATKQLALLLVDIVSPDIMYNGLPWPDEEFTRVTVERDLKICRTLDDHPVLWNILWGLAESRPSLCYCSVLLRACLAVQMSHWQSALCKLASDMPHQLDVTKKVLQLMSVGQYVPPPLDSISEVIDVLHPFHLYCVLIDVWNYVKVNVPSPVAFSTNADGALAREFEPYKNYKHFCERLRIILMRHVAKKPQHFRRYFVAPSFELAKCEANT